MAEYEPWRGPKGTCFYPRYDIADPTLLCDRDAGHTGNHAANGNRGRVYWPHRSESPDRPICTCASAFGEFIGCKLHGIEADDTNRPDGSAER